MADFLTTNQTLAAVERLIDGAEKKLTLMSPYQRLADSIRTRIADAGRRGVEVSIIYGDQDSDVHAIHTLSELPNTRVFHVPRLHAKCYANESELVITSLNLLVSSEKNWEMGVRLTSDERAYSDAMREIEYIIQNGKHRTSGRPIGRSQTSPGIGSSKGYCVRCRGQVRLDPMRPLCGACFDIWRQWEDVNYAERWCHECGREERTSFAMPRCNDCYYGQASSF